MSISSLRLEFELQTKPWRTLDKGVSHGYANGHFWRSLARS
jgi:hypothetical protein